MERQSGGVEFRQSPNRKNHHERHKSESSVRLSWARCMTFMVLIATSTDVGSDGNAVSVPHRQ